MKNILMLFIGLIVLVNCGLLTSCDKSQEKFQYIEKEEQIGVLTLWTSSGSYDSTLLVMNLGHSFFSFVNTSEQVVNIGYYECQVDEEITFGTWWSTPYNGLWYNLESMLIYDYDRYGDRVGVSLSMTQQEIDLLNDYLTQNKITWRPWENCTCFCVKIWNLLVDESRIINSMTPKKVSDIFNEKYETCENISIAYNLNIGYFDENNQFVKVTV